jgi:hypothetical protein
VTNGTELGRFLVLTDRRLFTVQSAGVEVDEAELIQGLAARIARLGTYQIWVCAAQEPVPALLVVRRVAPGEALPEVAGTRLCDGVVDFYDSEVNVVSGAAGTAGEFTLPDGPGRYRCVISTDLDQRSAAAATVHDVFDLDLTPAELNARLRSLPGQESYDLLLQFHEPLPDDEDDD